MMYDDAVLPKRRLQPAQRLLTKLRRILRRSNLAPQKQYDLMEIAQARLAQKKRQDRDNRSGKGVIERGLNP